MAQVGLCNATRPFHRGFSAHDEQEPICLLVCMATEHVCTVDGQVQASLFNIPFNFALQSVGIYVSTFTVDLFCHNIFCDGGKLTCGMKMMFVGLQISEH